MGTGSRLLVVLAASLLLTIPFAPAHADDHGKVRMYKLNKKGQLLKQRWLTDTEQPGCHNTLSERKVHRFAQVGFAYCQLFSAENCTGESVLAVEWGGGKYRTATVDLDKQKKKIIQGTEWNCSYQ